MKSVMKSGVLVGVAILAAAMVGMTVADEPAKSALQGSWNDYPAKWIENSKQIPNYTPTNANSGNTGDGAGFIEEGGTSTDETLPAYPVNPESLDVEDPPTVTPEPEGSVTTPNGAYPNAPEVATPPIRHPWPRPPIRPPIQQQQSDSGGGFNWGGGKTGGGGNWGGGKTGGGFNWGGGKTGGGFNWGGGKTGGSFDWGKTRPPQSQQNSIPGGSFDRDQLLDQISELQRQNAMLKDLLQRLAEQQAMNSVGSTGSSGGRIPIP